ncbi:MAG: hypothetical protein JXA81_08750 [Sedimentisphaerales bacterium]|nr:hypothetical protein [Sedimentisphaerales bacterium]
MKKTFLLVLILTVGLASITTAAQDIWTKKADMPIATSLHSVGVVDGKIYVIGGTDNIYGWADYWSTVWEYDPSTDTWTPKADMPAGRARLCASVVDGKIYAIGGSPHRDSDIATVEMYEPATDTWTRKADMPRARCFLSSSVVDGKIYVIGGKIYPSETMVSTVEVYDPATDTWSRKANMPTARGMHSASVVDGKIYVIGGVTGALGPWISTVEAYDPATDTWTRKTSMPIVNCNHSASTLNGKIYVIGGANDWDYCLPRVEVYDPSTDIWSGGLNMPTARACHSASVVSGKIYTIGGIIKPSTWVTVSAVEVYDPNPLVVDFNGDGIVDAKDMCIMIDYWGTDEPLYDIAPPPFGDGTVDVHDLILLAEHLFEEIYPPELIAYWKLDETEGDIALNSVSDNHGLLNGSPAWQPETGKIDGALEFDGIDDYIDAGFVLNPASGPFSVLAWIKGGAPGQVIIAQIDGTGTGEIWLGADASAGNLMTGLVPPPAGRFVPQPLISETIITDGQWHHAAFVWDGGYRILYVDGIEAARDTAAQNPLKSATGGIIIGAGKSLDADAGTLFSDLIDDIRIYNIAPSAEKIAVMAQ